MPSTANGKKSALKGLNVIGFGHPLLDITSHVNTAFLEKYSVGPGQTMLALPEQLPVYEEISQHADVEYVPGGATMNAIRVCQWLSGDTNKCGFVGALGEDEFGTILERALRQTGVNPLFEKSSTHPTGTCACLIVGKERSLIANLGAALQFTMAHLNSERVSQALTDSDIVYAAGFFLNTISSPEAPLAVAKHCADKNGIFCMNLSAPYLCDAFKDSWDMIMPYVDYLFGNKNDALAYCKAQGWQTTGDHLEIAMKLVKVDKINKKRGRVVIITHGGDPTVAATDDGIIEFETPLLPPEEIIDLNGAGDAFVGGFLSQLSNHRTLPECIRAGQYAAAAIIRNHGCTFSETHNFVPGKDDINV
eukprot:TRINITY_DN16478_c0_g1_i1.p1 TRINITY_DN16478_c0_g1~~TRINITY_DN16478_c0_g1_i1.p1  ORF type:complete len:363 (+),score=56.41 TRINITY_DN16478_c0_g1_i1:87-1175(+)